MATRRAKMPALKPPLILQAEVETLKVQVEALRGVLADLVGGTESLLREVNPLTPTAKHVARSLRRSSEVLRTYACEQVRIYFTKLELDASLLDVLERQGERLVREGPGWLLIVREAANVPQRYKPGPLREVLARALAEERECW